jgi:diketogulonate reductase-like aldo/keto reductase
MDCGTVNPSTPDRIRAAIGQGEHFLDTCIIGSPPKLGGPSPTPLTAYAPLAQGRAANDPTLATIGRKHGGTAAQVAIAWLLDQESVIAIPKAGRPESQKADLDALGISLDDEDRAAIAALPKDQRFVQSPFAPEWNAVA